jgi:hypothetical protein
MQLPLPHRKLSDIIEVGEPEPELKLLDSRAEKLQNFVLDIPRKAIARDHSPGRAFGTPTPREAELNVFKEQTECRAESRSQSRLKHCMQMESI